MDITQQIKNWAIDSYLAGCVYERHVILSGQTQYATLYVIQTKSRCWGLKNQLRNINVGRWNFQNKTIKKMDWPSWTDYDLSGPFQTTLGQFRPYLTLSDHLESFRNIMDLFGLFRPFQWFQTQQKKSVTGFFEPSLGFRVSKKLSYVLLLKLVKRNKLELSHLSLAGWPVWPPQGQNFNRHLLLL